MATRSSISIIDGKTKKTIYCHWDGYPSNNGATLLRHYNTKEKVLELLKLGNLSILGDKIGEKVTFDGFNSTENSQCLAYGRDRGEEDQQATTFKTLPTDLQEYNYLFKEGKWFVSEDGTNNYVPLTEEMVGADS